MAKTTSHESADTRTGGIYGLVLGAVAGAMVLGMLAIILDLAGVAHGSVVPGMIAGATLGGLGGLMYGALSMRRITAAR